MRKLSLQNQRQAGRRRAPGVCSFGRGSRFLVGLFYAVFLLGFISFSVSDASEPDLKSQLPERVFPVLHEILAHSAERSWRMIEESLRVEEARGEAEGFSSRRYPSVSGSFRYTGRLEDRDDFERARSFYQPQAALITRQPLYHWGSLSASHRIGQIRSAIAKNNRAEGYRILALEIRSAFLDFAIREQAIRVAEWRHDLTKLEHEAADGWLERGEITGEERTGFRLASEESALHLERQRRDQARALDEFSRLSGWSMPVDTWKPVTVAMATPPDNKEIEAVYWMTDEGFRPGREMSLGRVRQAEEQYQVERVRDRPQIDLIAGVAQDQVAVFDRSDIDRTVLFGGIEVTWQIFDGFESRGRRSAAAARKSLEERRHERQEREWTANLQELGEAISWRAREVRISEERMELAARLLSEKRDELERGLISPLEMAAAQVAFGERELAAVQRRAEYLMTVAEFLSEAGVDPAMDVYRVRSR